VGGLYPLTPVLIGNAWYVLNCHTGLYAGWAGFAGNYPRVWNSAGGAIDFASRVLKGLDSATYELVWVPEERVRPVPKSDTLHTAAAKEEAIRTWAPMQFATHGSRLKAVADAVGLPVPNSPQDNYRLLRAVEDLIGGRIR